MKLTSNVSRGARSTNSRTLVGKADGCSQWFLSRLAYEKPTARRVLAIRRRPNSVHKSKEINKPHNVNLKIKMEETEFWNRTSIFVCQSRDGTLVKI